MYRGTTPTITINCDIDVSEFVTMWVTFRTQQLATYAPPKQVEVTKHLGDEGVDATGKVVTVSLTQADTLLLGSLSPDEDQQVEVQIRGRTEDGRAFASNIMTAPLSRILKDGDGSNVTVAFEAAAKREAPVSGEKLSVLLGKVLKFFSDLKTVAFSGSYKDLSDKPTIPSAAADVGAIPATEKGAAGGVAELDSGGKVPANQLPSYVDDVVDAYIRTGVTALGANWLSKTSGGAALTPESDKIYVILSEGEYQNKTYRWSGTTYAVIGNDLAIGETASTAYRGDRGKTAYDHSQSAHAPADAEKNVQSDWNETDGNSDAFIKNKPAIPKAVTKTVQTLSDAASKSFTVTGYILSVILIDSATKEQVIGDISFENATASANGKVTVTLAAAPSNPILVIITSIAL